jgi:thiamine pyrophosphate-dependent acetolactate synthase large subunit-like protein
MPYLTGAQAAIATLRAHDIQVIFGMPGAHTLPLYDAIYDEPSLRHILARHEQGAGFMADGYARASGRPGVVSTTTGPGVTNVTTPVANAYEDSVPLLVISSGLPRASTGRPRGALHEMKNQFGVMEALVGWSRTVTGVEEIPGALRDAFWALRSGRPRAAYLEIPLDLLKTKADVDIPTPALVVPARASESDIIAAANLLRESKRPLIIAGAGVTTAGANEQLARLAELLQAPVLLGGKSRDVLPTDHALVIATTGYTVSAELIDLMKTSDVVLVVGSKIGEERTAGRHWSLPPSLIQIDIDPAEIGRLYPATVGLVADARCGLEDLLEALSTAPGEWHSRAAELASVRDAQHKLLRQAFGEKLSLLDALHEALPHDGVVVADMTRLGYASARHLPVYEPRTYIHPSEFCPIGCALPMALGAKVAAPGRPVVALCGDGGFLLNMGELATAVQEKIDIVVVVFNDAAYTAVKMEQEGRYNQRYIATDLLAPDYVAVARAFGAHGVRVNSPGGLREAINLALGRKGTTLIEVPLLSMQW